MEMVNITINGQKISAQAGITILKAAQQAGIDIPTLCNHPALPPTGACRICVVEVEGQRTLITACTFPITDGLVIHTDSPLVRKARKFILDMLFSERNHFCMYCEMSGDCELQNLGYRMGIDHWVFPTYTRAFPVDTTRKYFLMDHNRCVLCGRCERACGNLVANHTLGLRNRGAKSMIHADANLPFAESSCISCGTCLQVCPTGALCDKRSAYMGRDEQTEHVKTTCNQCSVGCAMEIVTRGGNVLKITGDWDGDVNKGVLCQLGRFEPLYDERMRITTPLIREKGKQLPVSWDDALQAVASRFAGADAKNIAVLTSSNITNEAIYVLNTLFREQLNVTNIGLLNKATTTIFEKTTGKLADIEKADLILVVGADPVKDQPVASFIIKRTVDRGARLIVVDDKDNGLLPFAYMHLKMNDVSRAVEIADRASYPVVVYGNGITEKAVQELKKLDGKACGVVLEPGVNTRAAVSFGINGGVEPAGVKALYVILGEEKIETTDIIQGLDRDTFIVTQASFASPLTVRADVVLPMAIWSERSGSLTNTEGRVLPVRKAVEPEGEAKPDWEILSLIAEKLNKKVGASLEELTAQATQKIK